MDCIMEGGKLLPFASIPRTGILKVISGARDRNRNVGKSLGQSPKSESLLKLSSFPQKKGGF